jgi:hypothetical protein
MKKQILPRVRRVLCAALALVILQSAAPYGTYGAIPKTEGITLRNIPVFLNANEFLGSKGDGASLNTVVWGGISFAESVEKPHGNRRVFRLARSGSGEVMCPVNGWGTFSLEDYLANGRIQLELCGASGGEKVTVGLRSRRNMAEESATVTVTASSSWITVNIPLKELAAANPRFSAADAWIATITMPESGTVYIADMFIGSPDDERQYPMVKVNQAGYIPGNEKYALVSHFPGKANLSENTGFSVLNTAGEVMHTGRLTLVLEHDAAVSGEVVYKADFTGLTQPGEYFLRVDNAAVADSFKFTVADSVYSPLLADLLRYFYFQRQGIDLEEKHAGQFARKNLHPGDSAVKKLSGRDNPNAPVYDLSGGWYDAGDFGKYFPRAANAVTDLLLMYETFPNLFADGQLNIPESGSGSPDVLDEARWQLDLLLKFEDGNTGGFYNVMNELNGVHYIIDTCGVTGAADTKCTLSTANAAAVFAHAYIVYKDIPSQKSFADTCLAAAKRAWGYLQQNPAKSWVSGAGRGYDYSDNELKDNIFWASAMLFRATGEKMYEEFFLANYRDAAITACFNAYSKTAYGGEMAFIGFTQYLLSPNHSAEVRSFFTEHFKTKTNSYEKIHVEQNYMRNAWPNAIPSWAYFWGSVTPISHIPLAIYMGNLVLDDRDGMDTAVEMLRDAAHYLLGINAMSFSYISGYGENSVKNIYSGIFSDKAKLNPYQVPRGYIAGGANQYEAGLMSRFPAKCYTDSDGEWTTNENCIPWNAAAAFLVAAVIGTSDIDLPSHSYGEASPWAREGIAEAIGKGFVPAEIQGRYQNVITRAEFCRLAVRWVEYTEGKSIDDVLAEQGKTRNVNAFTDTNDPDILAAYALGITSGTGGGRFTPDGQFTREQSAVMIMNTLNAIGWVRDWDGAANADLPQPFDDLEAASEWARPGISSVQLNGIMAGTGNNNFSPKALYTREQSIVTFNNIRLP